MSFPHYPAVILSSLPKPSMSLDHSNSSLQIRYFNRKNPSCNLHSASFVPKAPPDPRQKLESMRRGSMALGFLKYPTCMGGFPELEDLTKGGTQILKVLIIGIVRLSETRAG